jgi:hypothetical protein
MTMYKALTQILAVILIVLACVYIIDRNHRKNKKDNDSILGETIKERDRQINQLYQKIGVLERDLVLASNQVAELQQQYNVQIAELKDRSAAQPSSGDREVDGYQKYADGLTSLIESPEMIQNTRRRIEDSQVKVIYGAFIKNSLTTAKDARIITELLVDHYFLEWRMRVELMNMNLSRRERVAVIERVEKEQKEIDVKIKAQLGEDLYRDYQKLKKTGDAREFVHTFNSQLTVENQPVLSDIQTKRIIAVVTKELNAFHACPAYIEFRKMPPSQLTEATVNTIIKLVTDTYSRIREQSAKLLKPVQKNVLDSLLDHMLDQQVTSLEFTLKMINKEKKE